MFGSLSGLDSFRQYIEITLRHAAHAARDAGALAFDVLPAFEIETPRNPQFGDYAANLAMLLAKQARRNPREVAEAIRQHLPEDAFAWVERVEVAGAGFLNFYLKPDWAGAVVRHILQRGMGYGNLTLGAGKRVLIEFVSANPTGPLTLGHGRNAAVGDTLARLYEAAGYAVEREFYINDGENSTQIRNFALSVLTRYRQLLGEPAEMPEDGYHGEYVKEMAQGIRDQYGDSFAQGDPETVLKRFEQIAKQQMLQEQARDLATSACASTAGSRSRACTIRARCRRRWSAARRAATPTNTTARSGSSPPRSATRKTACWCARTGCRPTWQRMSPITAISTNAAMT
jgi:arginyl-tRNA synthetase